ncbi:MAG: hypothetical protein JOS17DRAFT_67821 [Linnemannia elongata]|nr:MAG: hypothetical protein JOS17DRAFT_67821 [Linnemannia elongata]
MANGEWSLPPLPSLLCPFLFDKYLFRPLFSFLFAPSPPLSFSLLFLPFFVSSFTFFLFSFNSTRLFHLPCSHPSTIAFYSTFFCCSTQPTTILDQYFADTTFFAYTQSSRALDTTFFISLCLFFPHIHSHTYTQLTLTLALVLTLNTPIRTHHIPLPPSPPTDFAPLGLHLPLPLPSHFRFYRSSTSSHSTALPSDTDSLQHPAYK